MSSTVRPIGEGDFFTWYPLFSAYAGSEGTPVNDAIAVQVWQWLSSSTEALEGSLAVDDEQNALGAVHFRRFPVPRSGSTGIIIDDLFVADGADKGDVASLLLEDTIARARAAGHSVVRWDDDIVGLDNTGELVEGLIREVAI